jgi:hypothetical protein
MGSFSPAVFWFLENHREEEKSPFPAESIPSNRR